ncbi:MAG: FAD:protein FMN transferase [Thermoguttaceae bacterium]|nr:FAD:protein FMN transferase [Thermoguttaceae bacterium]
MTQSENNSENAAENKAKSGGMFGSIRSILVIVMIGFLLYTLGKENPKVQAIFQRFSLAQQAADPSAVLRIGGETMGTFYTVQIACPPRAWDAEKLRGVVEDVLSRVDDAMTTYRDDSYVSRFNASDSTDWFEVSAETAEVVALAQEISGQLDGAFDITVAPLVNAWRFGPDKTALTALPGDDQIEAIRQKCGYQKLEVRAEPSPALKKAIPELMIDLSGIAKGYAVDKVAEALAADGLENCMVNVGGEIRCSGAKGDIPWTLAIEKPIPTKTGDPQIYRLFRPGAIALATSGGSRNYSVVAQKMFSHIIDPRTGRPTELRGADAPRPDFELGSVSVFDASCARADALATGLFVLGPEEGKAAADRLEEPVLFVSRSTLAADTFADEPSAAFSSIQEFFPGAPQGDTPAPDDKQTP